MRFAHWVFVGLLLMSCALTWTRATETKATSPESRYTWPDLHAPWKDFLDGLPFELQGLWGKELTPADPKQLPEGLDGISALNAEAIATAFRQAGFVASATQFNVSGPPVQPPAVEIAPLKLEVLAASTVKTGTDLMVVLRMSNMGFTPLAIDRGSCDLLPILEDEFGRPVRWINQSMCITALWMRSIAPRHDGDTQLRLPLDQFNPRIPLPPGKYRVKVVVSNVSVGLSAYEWHPLTTTVTGPWVTVTP